MKKIYFLFTVFITIVSLSSCVSTEYSFVKDYQKSIEHLSTCDLLTMDMFVLAEASQGNQYAKQSENIKMIIGKDPIYIEVIDDNNTTDVFYEEYGNIYQYSFFDENILKREFVASKSDYNNEYINIVDELIIDVEGNKNNVFNARLKKRYDEYIIEGKFEDFVDLDSELGEIYKSMGLDDENVKNSSISLRYMFVDNSLSFKTKVSIPYQGAWISVSIGFLIKECELEDRSWYGNVPRYELKDYVDYKDGDNINFGNIYKIDLEKGQYALYSSNVGDYWTVNYSICDEFGEKVDCKFQENFGFVYNLSHVRYVFLIPEDGTYYIKTGTKSDKEFDLVKLDYDTDFNKHINITEGNYTCTIDGGFEINKYVFTSEYEGVYKITNNSNDILWVIAKNENDQYQQYNIEDVQYLKLDNGENIFYICEDDLSLTGKKDYNFSLELIEKTPAPLVEYDNLIELEQSLPENPYITGMGYEDCYLKLLVEESGTYNFHHSNLVDNEVLYQLFLYDTSTDSTQHLTYISDNQSIVLEAGKYVVRIINKNELVIVKPYYERVS